MLRLGSHLHQPGATAQRRLCGQGHSTTHAVITTDYQHLAIEALMGICRLGRSLRQQFIQRQQPAGTINLGVDFRWHTQIRKLHRPGVIARIQGKQAPLQTNKGHG